MRFLKNNICSMKTMLYQHNALRYTAKPKGHTGGGVPTSPTKDKTGLSALAC